MFWAALMVISLFIFSFIKERGEDPA
jgi:hypothetical protein